MKNYATRPEDLKKQQRCGARTPRWGAMSAATHPRAESAAASMAASAPAHRAG